MKTIIYFLLSVFLSNFAYADEFTRSYKFKPIHIEKNQFLKVAMELYEYIEKVNNKPGKVEADNLVDKGVLRLSYVSLKGEDDQTEINFPIDQSKYEKFPKTSYDGRIIIQTKEGVVKSLQCYLWDSSRTITVTGASQDYVSGVINFAIEKFRPYETNLSGGRFRFILAMLLYVIAITIYIIITHKLRQNNISLVILSVSFMLLPNAFLFLPPWEKIFPGFLVSLENMSFLEKNSATFSFLGLIATVVIPLIGLFKFFKKRKIQQSLK